MTTPTLGLLGNMNGMRIKEVSTKQFYTNLTFVEANSDIFCNHFCFEVAKQK